MSRRTCIDLYLELVRRHPTGQEDDDKGSIKVIMTGSVSDQEEAVAVMIEKYDVYRDFFPWCDRVSTRHTREGRHGHFRGCRCAPDD